jgi:iron complex transport system ATP-binding protein
VVTVLHDLNLALAADRIVVMQRGRVVADGPPADGGLRLALTAVFDHAFSVEAVQVAGRVRWVAVPAL